MENIISDEYHVLLVDDSRDFLDLFGIYARKNHLRLITATTGTAALSILQAEELDCILLDYMLPDLSGAEIFDRIQTDRRMRKNRLTPVIMISAVSVPYSKLVPLYDRGISLFLSKSFGLCELSVLVENFSLATRVRRLKARSNLESVAADLKSEENELP